MPIPQQVNDRIKEAPAVMLRAVFAGVGQLLLAADKVRARAAATGWPPDLAAVKDQVLGQSRWHTLDDSRSGAVPLPRERTSHTPPAQRPSPAHPADATVSLAPATTEVTSPAHTSRAAAEPAAVTEPTEPPAAAAQPAEPPAGRPETAGDVPPLPGYDDLTLPSLRARLRGFDADTLRTLLAYEKAHARRDDVITLFERRLAKITAG
jgi:hypothetical protein